MVWMPTTAKGLLAACPRSYLPGHRVQSVSPMWVAHVTAHLWAITCYPPGAASAGSWKWEWQPGVGLGHFNNVGCRCPDLSPTMETDTPTSKATVSLIIKAYEELPGVTGSRNSKWCIPYTWWPAPAPPLPQIQARSPLSLGFFLLFPLTYNQAQASSHLGFSHLRAAGAWNKARKPASSTLLLSSSPLQCTPAQAN